MFYKSTGSKTEKKSYQDIWIVLFLVMMILAVYGQVYDFEFINLDDPLYVENHSYVKTGLTPANIEWAFIFRDREFSTYWHPMTWLSHMLDCELFGVNPGRHHLVNVLFHIANSLLLFAIFKRMTGARWPSAFLAALFALHPLNVESVAWIAERKNVLSTLFWLLTMLAYLAYTERPILSRYLLTLLIFTLGLMAKPMLVTLPFVLLLMDFWPLGRFEIKQAVDVPGNNMDKRSNRRVIAVRLIVEKIPLLGLSLSSVYLSYTAVQSFQTIAHTGMVSMKLRVFNALVTYVKYILKMLWPQDLAVLYPYPDSVLLWQVMGAVLILSGISIIL